MVTRALVVLFSHLTCGTSHDRVIVDVVRDATSVSSALSMRVGKGTPGSVIADTASVG